MFRVLAALGALTLALPAAGHYGQDQAGKVPFVVGGTVLGGLTTWGLVSPVGDHWERVCEEAIGPVAYFAYRRASGDILVGALDGLLITRDRGCSYQLLSGALDALSPSSMALANGSLFATSAQYGQQNGVFQSNDDGESWTPVYGPQADLLLFRISASADGSHLVATGSRSGASTAPVVLVSTNGGSSFQDVSSGYAGYVIASAMGFLEDGTSAMIAGLTSANESRVLVASAGSYASPAIAGDIPGDPPPEVKHGVSWQGAIWTVAPLAGALFRKGPSDSAFVQVTDARSGPTNCIFVHPDGDRLIGCGRQTIGNPGLFMESTDGATWTGIIDFADVGYRICPTDTVGFTACSTYFEWGCGNGTDDDFDQLVDCDDEDCVLSCAGEGEGEGEGEGDPGEGEGEGDVGEGEGEGEPDGCPCSGAGGADLSLLALVLLTWRGRRAASAA
ncbi:MAG: hypothetical protein HYS27_00435 [Deltaproteobacteria bacterium]|nr:hypothetical protein [Deltaproteobacteria bacterium]